MALDFSKFEQEYVPSRPTKLSQMTPEQQEFMFGLRKRYLAGKVSLPYRSMVKLLLEECRIRISVSCLHAFLHDDGTQYPEGKPDGKAKKRSVR